MIGYYLRGAAPSSLRPPATGGRAEGGGNVWVALLVASPRLHRRKVGGGHFALRFCRPFGTSRDSCDRFRRLKPPAKSCPPFGSKASTDTESVSLLVWRRTEQPATVLETVTRRLTPTPRMTSPNHRNENHLGRLQTISSRDSFRSLTVAECLATPVRGSGFGGIRRHPVPCSQMRAAPRDWADSIYAMTATAYDDENSAVSALWPPPSSSLTAGSCVQALHGMSFAWPSSVRATPSRGFQTPREGK